METGKLGPAVKKKIWNPTFSQRSSGCLHCVDATQVDVDNFYCSATAPDGSDHRLGAEEHNSDRGR